jgi:hypothetical protein
MASQIISYVPFFQPPITPTNHYILHFKFRLYPPIRVLKSHVTEKFALYITKQFFPQLR